MARHGKALRRTRAFVALALVGALAAACGGGDDEEKAGSSGGDSTAAATGGSDNGGSTEKVKLVLNDFGNFGYADLLKEYQKDHPNITVVERQSEYNQHHQRLQQQLAAGSGTGDIEAVDEGFVVAMRALSDKFANLNDFGAADNKDRWLEWKWNATLTEDGKKQIGLGTDVGGLAMCYRTDLFKKAGLPTERDAVSALWADGGWDAFIEQGKKFEAKKTGAKWVDAATNMFSPILAQQEQGFYTPDDKLDMNGAGVKAAWDTTMKMIAAGESAGLQAFTAQWNAGFQKDTFATLACPAWMMGYIQGQAPKAKGKWDVAEVPGGGGNWGGSFLMIPAASKHAKEAYELANWLTDPKQTIRIFKSTGNLPSQPATYEDPQLKDFKSAYFNNAPVGEIFTKSAASLKPQYLGLKNGPVRSAVENAIRTVESKKKSADAAWETAVKDAERASK